MHLLASRRAHPLERATIDHGNMLGTEQLGSYCCIHGRHAAVDDDHVAANRNVRLLRCLHETCDKVHGVMHLILYLALKRQRTDASQSYAQKDSAIIRTKLFQRYFATQPAFTAGLDRADIQQPIDLPFREVPVAL